MIHRMDSLLGILSDIRVFFYGGMSTLPLTIAGTLLILGLFTANYAILFFLMGYLVIVPSMATLLNLAVDTLAGESNPFRISSGDVCKLAMPFTTLKQNAPPKETVVCSVSTAMISFFLGYVMTNAVKLYQRDSDANADPEKVSNRKTYALVSIVCISVFALYAVYSRMSMGCDSPWMGGLFSYLCMALFGAAGYGWYIALSSSAAKDRLADVFGVSNRILSTSATADVPQACFTAD